MTVEVETSDAAMASPTSSSGTGPESLRLSEIENAHLCPAGRMKMEELFRQWLNVDGTREMIQNMVADLRQGKELNLDALLATVSATGSGADSPSRSPKRPPNYQLGLLSTGSVGSPSARRRHQHLVSLFGDELHNAAAAVAAAAVETEAANPDEAEAAATSPADDVDMTAGDSEAACDNDGESAQETPGDENQEEPAEQATPADTDENMEGEQEPQTVEETPKAEEPAAAETDHPMAEEAPKQVQIPRFYTPGEGRRGRLRGLSTDAMARKASDIEARFREFPEGMKVEDFVAITKDLCGFPSFFNAPFFKRILATCGVAGETTPKPPSSPTEEDASSSPTSADGGAAPQRITKEMFQSYWMREMAPCDSVERFFRVVKQPKNDFIERDDFAPFLHELLKYHPGLEFLGGTPEFQEKYALTVVVRIFYSVDRDSSGRITLRKLRRSNLISAFNTVDEEEDINKVNSYFSYEHFYVLYCKFWELDTDHDFLLSPDDLVRYGGHALTRIIVDRIFERGRRPFARVQTLTSEEKKKMSYEDFIYFMLSEEDKANPVSIRYWFELIDTNEDGVLRADEMRVFYRHQIHRMECLGHEVVPFEDILCQMSDLLHPEKEGEFYHKDFIRLDKIRVSGVFFNVLFNLSKFIEFEQRDPFLLRQQLAEPELTDWDRYARAEYARLAMEEESRDEDTAMDIDTMDGWYVSDEQEEEAPEGGANADGAAGGEGRTVEAPF
ncbi:Serine/threonine protein phosphatase 2A regulatory subunit [Phytophthora cactorum]|uniref:Serine/threonine protein phosphatase 2A regulatory subunit n=1 Tax=Phytophthora cactorum TaxID=29920 RepID=A0A329S6Q4_9STRA|nr:Serine/threonine protein phosphatase 2A regulatory subunit [Phytophthora cactorum]KAG2833829.1 Serine/threonine protein phosphatase 2A regulatory subunit [Phytophthora cactorum]KAG2836243.1 Serine/threonine protein phosphatase 2A regulatory subunit [Phytophthora cactorum]KAG2861937.1 Serine/threonine protein phosphatase 2A regulatory subunit [Phytophthora cactorum]KAG2919031.1 Serine/threonine protein phosphatase 2A regulatory subunit [Phytophthora cactorum]